ncbi:MAG TPA: prolipoprotein diacylglyceryl transferase [Alphaproteobacteria bacterium]|nr:prolipoprotein diacylglyceryl transferase [Alphaproteobacteria bacterium]
MVFPQIDPVALHLGPLSIRWYALAYITGVVFGWLYARALAKANPKGPNPELYSDVLSWVVMGILLGGRIGYVLFYNAPYYLQHPLEALMLWRGGMSFHGGALGVIIACWFFCKLHKVSYLAFMDIVVCVVPIGLFFGRLANFVNGELYGRPADVPWAMVFPHGGPLPRHPSQLYEATLEGVVLFSILGLLARSPKIRAREGFLSGAFLALYALFRAFLENFREPDAQVGFLWMGLTMGQILCVPMALFGIYLILRSGRARIHDAA